MPSLAYGQDFGHGLATGAARLESSESWCKYRPSCRSQAGPSGKACRTAMAPLPERLTVTVDADSGAAEIRALAEEYRQIVADLRELRGKPGVHEHCRAWQASACDHGGHRHAARASCRQVRVIAAHRDFDAMRTSDRSRTAGARSRPIRRPWMAARFCWQRSSKMAVSCASLVFWSWACAAEWSEISAWLVSALAR